MKRPEPDRQNPVVATRERLGLSRNEVLSLSGVPYNVLWAVEKGAIPALPRKILAGFEKVGVNPESLANDYQTYRENKSREIVDRVKDQTAGGTND